MIARKVIFKGRVQGVGFRYGTKQVARGFEIVGWVRNLKDGTVELRLMGAEDEVSEFIGKIVEESDLASLIKEHMVPIDDPDSAQRNA